MNCEPLRSAIVAMKKSAKRELAVFVVMAIFVLAGLVIVLPVLWLSTFLPNWVGYWFMGLWTIWFFVGDTIAEGIRAYRGDKK